LSLRIGVDGRYLRHGWPGISRHLFELLRADGAGDDAVLVLLVDPGARAAHYDPRDLARPGLTLVDAPFAPRSLHEQIALPRLLRRLDLDVLLAPYPFTSLACPCPRVVVVHDLIALHPRHGLRPLPRRLLAGLALRAILRRAAVVLTPSHAARADAVAWLGLRPESVRVSGGAAGAAFRPQSRETIQAVRAHFDLPARVVLHVGAPQRHKNLDGLLRAWSSRPADGVGLVLAGAGEPQATALRARARRLGAADVRILGRVDDARLPSLYAAAEVCVLPSFDEGFGLPAVEAMACGTPVAASARGALPEVTGGAAALFDPDHDEALARTLARLLGDPAERAERARLGRERAGAYSWEQVAARTFGACRAAARGRAPLLRGDASRPAAVPEAR
jgi:glycosyltransferase involved in cell wall biosynthesis